MKEIKITNQVFQDFLNMEEIHIINQYTIIGVLGHGSCGNVYLATDNEKNKFALKEVSKTCMRKFKTNCSSVDSARKEIAIMKKIDHPNVIKLFEVLDDPNQDVIYMIFEYCKNGPVIQISDGDKATTPLKLSQCREYFAQLTVAIDYLHHNDIIHRDIKPENLLLNDKYQLKVADFGISFAFGDSINKKTGSPAFLAPEILTKKFENTLEYMERADIWAMGITLYCFAFGKVPFWGKTLEDLFHNIKSQE
jgi:serine/threonine protein kinase